ncbi:UNVERIFIED_CONTAM: DIBOA-glucoside dioxygenase BX6 [Sesamum latifolium]|uniref:DIBOA-glucoside dioxygenase BX6 n=1 Tax=Sesamum latifolium TaxID=2727402 RepID=A0AAW2TYR1_9LAMI
MANSEGSYDRMKEVQEFDQSKAGVKGLSDSGISTIPRIFIHPPESLSGLRNPSSSSIQIPSSTSPTPTPIPTHPKSSNKSGTQQKRGVSSKLSTTEYRLQLSTKPFRRLNHSTSSQRK